MYKEMMEAIAAKINQSFSGEKFHFVEPFCRHTDLADKVKMPTILGAPQYINTKVRGNSEVHLCDYAQLDIPRDSVIYCDPPDDIACGKERYAQFDWNFFYKWCEDRTFDGYYVLILDYVGRVPPHFLEVMRFGHVALYCHENQRDIWGA